MDVLASTATSSSLLRATDAAFEDLFPADGSDRLPGARSGASGVRFHKADGVETEEAGYGEAPVEEGEAAAAVRKSVYHLRQLKQVDFEAAKSGRKPFSSFPGRRFVVIAMHEGFFALVFYTPVSSCPSPFLSRKNAIKAIKAVSTR